MKMIVAVDENWAIGKDNSLLTDIPEDLARFKRLTEGKIVVMGRKTLESLPGGKPLPGRTNIILTRDKGYKVENAIVMSDTEHIGIYLKGMEAKEKTEVFVIGGAQIYELLLPSVYHVYVTKINDTFEADSWFPNLDNDPNWEGYPTNEEMEHNGIEYQYYTYARL